MVCTFPVGFGSQLIHWSERVQVSGRPSLAGCCRSVTLTVACCTLFSGGAPASGPISQISASWMIGSPLLAEMSSR